MAKNTITEVALAAGVSVITASRAMRGVGYVADGTRKKVLAAAKALDYEPDIMAQRMRGGSSRLIGVFVNHFGSSVVHELITSVNREARALGYDLLIFNAENFDAPGRISTSKMMGKLCDGVLLILPNVHDSYIDKLERDNAKCVLINFCARPINLPVVVGANRVGARQAVEHLISLGHQRIAFIAGSSNTGQSLERQRGYEEALAHAQIPLRPEYIQQGNFTHPTGVHAAKQLFALAERPTAIFAANDDMAFGVLDAAKEQGIQVPEQLSVIGYDDVTAANYVFPKLTTIRQPLASIASRAVKELVNIINGETMVGGRLELPTLFVERDSTGPAPKG